MNCVANEIQGNIMNNHGNHVVRWMLRYALCMPGGQLNHVSIEPVAALNYFIFRSPKRVLSFWVRKIKCLGFGAAANFIFAGNQK